MRNTWNFYSAGQLVFGCGAVRSLGRLTAERKLKRVLIVTDPVLVRVGLVERVLEPLATNGIQTHVFDGGAPEPAVAAAVAAAEVAHDYRPDAILGLGGGSNMDLAKFAAVLHAQGGHPRDYFGFNNVPGPVTPLICVPTTAGTGSEVSHAAVLTDTEQQLKVSTLSRHLRPALAVVDPELTLSCPATATADSGIDALTHAIEGYTAIDFDKLDVPAGESTPYDGKSPMGDLFAEKAISLVGQHLITAVKEPGNLKAREGMALAATRAGLAFSNSAVAVVHALEYPIGAVLHCSHGAGNGLLLPYVMRFNLPVRKAAFARVAELLGEETRGLDETSAAELAITAVERLRREIGIPERISQLGGTAEQLPGFATKSLAIRRLMLLNPRLPSEEDLLGILQAAL
jgi:alcohol dehydrogenase